MRVLRTLAIVALAASLAACGGPKITTDFAPSADFTKFKTYAWHPGGNNLPENPRYNSPLIDGRIKDAVEFALNQKGLTQVEPGQADLLVVYHAVVDQKIDVQTVNSYYGYSPYWGGYGRWGGWGGSTTYVNEYEEGTLILDLLENVAGTEERIVWRGMIQNTIKQANDAATARQRLRDGAVKLLADYPPGGAS